MLRSPMVMENTYLARRVGYDLSTTNVLYFRLNGDGMACSDPHEWGDRTNANAHMHIIQNWDVLSSGDVVDVEYILKETTEPKKSERITDHA